MNFRSNIRGLLEIALVSLRLGLTSFGGPTAHLGYFNEEYVRRRGWIKEREYGDLVALCQFLPGPASSQVGIGVGLARGGMLGGIVAWLGFTLPSALALVLFAWLLRGYDVAEAGWLHGLKIVAVAIVAQAILSMGQKMIRGRSEATIAVIAAAVALLWQSPFSQLALIACGGLAGWRIYGRERLPEPEPLDIPVKPRTGMICLAAFAVLLIALPLLRPFIANPYFHLFESFYRAGALVFGGGHVVLPLLERETVPAGLVGSADFIAGYGAAQAVPGPLFTFASYLGMVSRGLAGAAVATVAIFLPGFLLVVGALPFWNRLRSVGWMQGALAGINAAVIGLLIAALYDPIWVSAVGSAEDFALAAVLFLLLVYWKQPPWVAVAAGLAGGTLLAWL